MSRRYLIIGAGLTAVVVLLVRSCLVSPTQFATVPSPPPTALVIPTPPTLAGPNNQLIYPTYTKINLFDETGVTPFHTVNLDPQWNLWCHRDPGQLATAVDNPTVFEIADPYYLGKVCTFTFPTNLQPVNPLKVRATYSGNCFMDPNYTPFACESAKSQASTGVGIGNPPPPITPQAGNPAMPTQAVLYVIPTSGTDIGPFIQTLQPAECNKAASTAPDATNNPKLWRVNDPAIAGRFCEWPFPTTIPVGNGYRGASTFRGTCVVSGVSSPCESPRSPLNATAFNITQDVSVPIAPTVLQIK